MVEQTPVKEDASHGAVAIQEGVIVGEPVVQEDGTENRVQESIGGATVGEGEQGFEAGGEFGSGRRIVEEPVFEAFELDGFVAAAEAASGVGSGEGADGEVLMEVGKDGEGERLGADFADEFEGAVAVDGHLLAAVAWAATGAEEFAGDLGSEIGAFEVAGGDGLGHEGADGEMVAGVAVFEDAGQGGGGDQAAVEAVEGFSETVGRTQAEGAALTVSERDFAAAKLALDFEGEPPLAGGQIGRGGLEAEFGPMGVFGGDVRGAKLGDG